MKIPAIKSCSECNKMHHFVTASRYYRIYEWEDVAEIDVFIKIGNGEIQFERTILVHEEIEGNWDD